MCCHLSVPPRAEQKSESMWVHPPIVIINPSQLHFKGLGLLAEHLTWNEYMHPKSWHVVSRGQREERPLSQAAEPSEEEYTKEYHGASAQKDDFH